MKDGLDSRAIERLARNLALGYPCLDKEAFVEEAVLGLRELELKQRVQQVASVMARHLQPEFSRVIEGLLTSLPDWERGDAEDSLRGFATWPVFVFIEQQGLKDLPASLHALREMTHLFTGEFALRPFLEADAQRTLAQVEAWTDHESEHVRRLASEGIRPRLPWASRLPSFQKDPSPVFRVLEKLKDDPSEYVRRSVGNCLADIAVDHPELVIDRCRGWMQGGSAQRKWIVRRGSRNLIKSGYPGIWELHGYTADPQVRVEELLLSASEVSLDQKFDIRFSLRSLAAKPQKLVVDFVIHHVKANGKTSEKVFKLKELDLVAGDLSQVQKTHCFRTITTRKYYPGLHKIEIQINGQRFAQSELHLHM